MGLRFGAFKGKTVLVTGHTGFKGAWLSIWLHELGARIVGYALDPSGEKDVYPLSGLERRIVDVRGDICDMEKLSHTFRRYEPEAVFHLAAQPLVKWSYEQPRRTYEVNVMGTMNVLEAIRSSRSVRTGIMVTSDKCYDNKEWVWGYRETDPLGGYDPYSSSKGCCELLIASYRSSYFHPGRYREHGKAIASVRAGNVIGGGDWSRDRIIPDSIRALEAQQTIVVRNPHAVRPWQHVLDPLGGYLLLAERCLTQGADYAEAWNFGPGLSSAIPVSRMVEKLIAHWGSGSWSSQAAGVHGPHEAGMLSLDISKATHRLGWQPAWDVDMSLKKTVEWYKAYRTMPVYDLCVSQLKEFGGI